MLQIKQICSINAFECWAGLEWLLSIYKILFSSLWYRKEISINVKYSVNDTIILFTNTTMGLDEYGFYASFCECISLVGWTTEK